MIEQSSPIIHPQSARQKLLRLLFVLLMVLAIGCLALAQQASVKEQLAESRQQIDGIDRQIVELINKRAAVVEKIGKVKSAARLPITVPDREQQVLSHVAEMGGSGPFPVTRLKAIYSALLAQMRAWEEEQHHPTK